MKYKFLLFLIIGIFLINFVSASFGFGDGQSYGIFEKGSCINLIQTCNNCTYLNISSILYPNSSSAISNVAMTQTGTEYNYTFCDTNETGQYIVNGFGDPNNITEIWNYNFLITQNGLPDSGGIIAVTFIILLFIILGGLLFTSFTTISRVAYKEFYVMDVILAIGTYLSLVLYNYLSMIYFANPLVLKLLMVLMKVGVWTHVILPIIAFGIILLLNLNSYNTSKNNSDNYAHINDNMDFGMRNNKTYAYDPYRRQKF